MLSAGAPVCAVDTAAWLVYSVDLKLAAAVTPSRRLTPNVALSDN